MRPALIILALLLTSTAFADKKTPVQGGLPEVAATVDWLVQAVGDILDTLADLDITPPVTHLTVNCNGGDSLAAAIDDIDDGGTIDVSGACNEKVVIDGRSGITINGDNTAKIDGIGLSQAPGAGTFAGLVTITNSDNIALNNLEITNGPDGGLYVSLGSVVQVIGCAVHSNSFDGMDVFGGSFINIVNSGFDDNGRNGVLAGSSTLYYSGFNTNGGNTTGISLISTDVMIFGGQTFASHNSLSGVIANDGSVVQVEGSAQLETNSDGTWGVLALNGSNIASRGSITSGSNIAGISLRAASFNTGGGTVTLGDNQYGILAESSTFYSNENTTLEITQSNFGMLLFDSTVQLDGSFQGLPESPVSIFSNDFGILARDDSFVRIQRPTTLSNNNTGVRVDSSILVIDGESFGGNNLDVSALFGAKLDFTGGAGVGTVHCDSTVLARGVSC